MIISGSFLQLSLLQHWSLEINFCVKTRRRRGLSFLRRAVFSFFYGVKAHSYIFQIKKYVLSKILQPRENARNTKRAEIKS
jgi:hypothetical protein